MRVEYTEQVVLHFRHGMELWQCSSLLCVVNWTVLFYCLCSSWLCRCIAGTTRQWVLYGRRCGCILLLRTIHKPYCCVGLSCMLPLPPTCKHLWLFVVLYCNWNESSMFHYMNSYLNSFMRLLAFWSYQNPISEF